MTAMERSITSVRRREHDPPAVGREDGVEVERRAVREPVRLAAGFVDQKMSRFGGRSVAWTTASTR
jgi:hypothetical protein